MRILGIETSCDETAAAVVEGQPGSTKPLKIISCVVASSAELQAKFGGIVPEQAARQQIKVMIPTLWECLRQMTEVGGPKTEDGDINKMRRYGDGIDAIAVTIGPGLVGSLLVGVETAKTLAYAWEKPIIPVNHLVAHLYANFIKKNQELRITNQEELPLFPAIGLVISGGHTDMVLMKDHRELRLIGRTRDDAAGECFDKCARMLGLPYPGGPEIAKLADKWIFEKSKVKSQKSKFDLFPRPLSDQDNFDWSFSGLKTAVLYYLQKNKGVKLNRLRKFGRGKQDQTDLARISAEIQEAICQSLIIKLSKAIKKYKPKSLLVAGGVAANKRLTQMLVQLNRGEEWKLFVPPPKLCTDNGAYIAAYAFYRYSPKDWTKIEVNPGLAITDRT
ncbi:MAG: putative tRNA threonylcarbamoyladenosine biosynthesis protein Gcp [Microgenomates group bacterium GW2011_GWA2_44_7]|nr:MAG: putative tRNA threonylcarbamoyladenosine biosynthesis protein Gcp [Microgenomates group bacterium GW2011_GWA2_44_7]KKT76906.1 MAG: putative tRNA threonylcarbamoyladenosine biosynthesis protein Gcp [Microgenomates group bacterium GW2011_GWB1_44_8]